MLVINNTPELQHFGTSKLGCLPTTGIIFVSSGFWMDVCLAIRISLSGSMMLIGPAPPLWFLRVPPSEHNLTAGTVLLRSEGYVQSSCCFTARASALTTMHASKAKDARPKRLVMQLNISCDAHAAVFKAQVMAVGPRSKTNSAGLSVGCVETHSCFLSTYSAFCACISVVVASMEHCACVSADHGTAG